MHNVRGIYMQKVTMEQVYEFLKDYENNHDGQRSFSFYNRRPFTEVWYMDCEAIKEFCEGINSILADGENEMV